MFLVCVVFFCVGKFASGSLQGEEVSKWANAIGGQLWSLGKEVTKADEISENYNYLNAKVTEKHPKVLIDDIKNNILRMMDRKMDAITCIQQKAEGIAESYAWNGSHSRYRSSTYSFYGVRDDSANNNTGTFWKLNYPDVLNYPDNLYRRYKPMILTPDTHFYNIPVNTSHSSVHVPTNVYDREGNVSEVIEWSEALDEVFAQNYKSDPALSWQYFGSSTGIMRLYPAMHWSSKQKEIRTLFDCRIRTWYIEAATCTKDVIILLDNSGSMDAMGKHIASLTASSILDTFSNNDYVNILNYSDTTSYLIPCFAEQLVQATEENIVIFKEAIKTLKPDGKTSIKKALETAFDVLKKYRERRQCDDVTKPNCNQAIMILTDGLSANYSDLMMTYNRIEAERAGLNESYIPVRIFTYLTGGETTNVQDIKWLACHNRGYHSAVPNLERVTASVMEYINVVARPLVLQGAEHPISWTHAYADVTYDDEKDTTINEPARLLTSAAIPLFDKKINKQNDTVTALLLGVAATDVPIDEFRKLTTPYKIGVNGYAFIVSNNGYILMHPDLRPTFKNMLKENYNSIDFTEVEQIDEDFPARNITMNKTIKKLRNALVQGEEGSMSNIRLKYHYDDWKRVAEETYDYFFVALEDKELKITTPFSLGIAIPSSYGKFEITPSMNQIKKYQFSGEDIGNYFKGNNWRVHPRWVYCKYHYLEGHEYESQEEELLHFLGNIYNDNFKWHGQYEKEENETMGKVECGRKTLGDDDYYCDQDLMERLIFDATNTYTSFGEPYAFQTKVEEDLFNDFEVLLRFVGTMSGLTRWDDFSENPKIKNKHGVSSTKDIKPSNEIPLKNFNNAEPTNDTEPSNEIPTNNNNTPENSKTQPTKNSRMESDNNQRKNAPSKKFGDIPLRAIDEKWYKSAVLQRNFDIDSFVYSVPFTYDELNEVVITGSFAIFVKEGGKEAPGCVVGYQFSQQKFAKKVEEITDKLSNQCSYCDKCGQALDCYIIDSTGYILYSSYIDTKTVGQFFGEIEGDIMDTMLEEKIFEKKTLYDYQAYCAIKDEVTDAGCILRTTVIYWMTQINFYHLFDPFIAMAEEIITADTSGSDAMDITILNDTTSDNETEPINFIIPSDEEEVERNETDEAFWKNTLQAYMNVFDNVATDVPDEDDPKSTLQISNEYFACDTKVNLFTLRQKLFITENYHGEVNRTGRRTFYVKRVPNSNLVFVAIESKGPKHTEVKYTTEPHKLSKKPIFLKDRMNETILPCRKLYLNNLPRRRLTGCFNDHEDESKIVDCGRAAPVIKSVFYPLLVSLTFLQIL